MRDATAFIPARSALVAATVAIAAAFFYFLTFAQLALFELAQPIADTTQHTRLMMTLLGLGGIVGSLLGAWRFRMERYPQQLANAFRACGLAAVIALIAQTPWLLLAAAAATGLALGWLTVSLVSGLRAVVGTPRLGLVTGVGAGLAYAVCNLSWLFAAEPRTHTIAAAIVVIVAALLGAWMLPQEPSVSPTLDYSPLGMSLWVALFLALVWMDSAAFAVLQRTPALREAAWGSTGSLLGNASSHLFAAVAAGWLLDRGWLARVVALGFAGLVAACVLLDPAATGAFGATGLVYAAAVSFYSTALVYYPARGGRRWLTGLVFAIAGWLGAAMGIGMAQELNRVPWTFLVAAGLVVVGALVMLTRLRGRQA